MRGALIGLALMLTAAGCTSLASRVKARAAHDFKCSQDKLRILDQEGGVFRIAGCGQVATFVCRQSRTLKYHCHRSGSATPPAAGGTPITE